MSAVMLPSELTMFEIVTPFAGLAEVTVTAHAAVAAIVADSRDLSIAKPPSLAAATNQLPSRSLEALSRHETVSESKFATTRSSLPSFV